MLVGAQAVYEHTRDHAGDYAASPSTFDADRSCSWGKPRVVDAMQNAGYRLTDQPGVYRRDDGLQVDLLVPKAVGGRSGESRGHCERHKPSSRTGSQAATHPKRRMLPHTSDSGSVRKMVKGQPRGTVLGHLGIWRANSDRIPLMQIVADKRGRPCSIHGYF